MFSTMAQKAQRQYLRVKCVFTISALGVISHNTENAKRSTCCRNEHRFVPSSSGSISIRLSTRYTVVQRLAASSSIGVVGLTKCDTSAMSYRVKEIREVNKLICT